MDIIGPHLGLPRLASFSSSLLTKAKMSRVRLSKLLISDTVCFQLPFFGAFFLMAYSGMVYNQVVSCFQMIPAERSMRKH